MAGPRRSASAVALPAVALLASCGSADHRSPRPLAVVRPPAPAACTTAQIAVLPSTPEGGATGEVVELVVLRNRSSRSCTLDGYPRVLLYQGTRRLGFAIRDGGGYATARAPRRLSLAPGADAFVLLAKFRCESFGAGEGRATAIRIGLPSGDPTGEVSLPVREGPVLSYCGAAPGPGGELDVSPFELTRDGDGRIPLPERVGGRRAREPCRGRGQGCSSPRSCPAQSNSTSPNA